MEYQRCNKSGKVIYDSFAEAQEDVNKINKVPDGRPRLQTYYCEECQGYHKGHGRVHKMRKVDGGRHDLHLGEGFNLSSLPHIRATQLLVFERCSRQFAEQYLGGTRRPTGSRASQIGTAVHALIEAHVTRQQPEYVNWEMIPDKEKDNLVDYMNLLTGKYDEILAIEHEFKIQVIPDALPVVGHIDMVTRRADGTLVIIDHKTNRMKSNPDYWYNNLQPLCYSYAARRIWPDHTAVKFIIGYVNHVDFLEWQVNPEDDHQFELRFADLWERMRLHDECGIWTETVNDYCTYCPVKMECSTYLDGHLQFLDQIGQLGGS